MRKVRFNFLQRVVLIPLEAIQSFKYVLLLGIIFVVISGISKSSFSFITCAENSFTVIFLILIPFISGTILTPTLLPYLPARSFSLKGFVINTCLFLFLVNTIHILTVLTMFDKIAWFLLTSAISSFLAMNFTGASTYTSLSGVKKEMRVAIPFQITGFLLGLILFIFVRFI